MASDPEPLSRPWIKLYRARLEPSLSPLERVAMYYVWDWLDGYWGEAGDSPKRNHHLFAQEALPFFDEVEQATADERGRAIVALAEFFRSLSPSVAN